MRCRRCTSAGVPRTVLDALGVSGQAWRVRRVLDTRHDSTRRECQSMIATRYMNPFAMGIYEMSVHQHWFARSTDRPRSR